MIKKIHPHIGDTQTVYLNTVVRDLSVYLSRRLHFLVNKILFNHIFKLIR